LCSLPVPKHFGESLRSFHVHCSVGHLQDLAVCALCDPFSLQWAVYATAVLKFSTGTNGRCARSTASRYVTMF
jgi:hypothetical protein